MKKLYANNDPTKYTLVDDDVFDTIQKMNIKFYIDKYGYFRSTTKIQLQGIEKKKRLYLHQFVWILKTKTEPSSTVDHIDFNPLNNQFENLRLASRREQSQHRGKMKNNTSDYIGVSVQHVKHRGNNYYYWCTHIHKPDGHVKAKTFPYTPEGKIAAAKYYDSKTIEYHGEFAVLNFPMPSDKQ